MPVRRNSRGKWIYRTVVKLKGGSKVRISGTPEHNTKETAQQAERDHIDRVQNPPVPPAPKKEVPKFATFADEFMLLARVKNKPSEIDSKESILRVHLKPAFEGKKLDQIGYAEIQDYAAKKTLPKGDRAGLSKKTVNNHLTVLRRLLVVAKKRGLIEAVPEIEWLRAPKPDFDFLDFDEADRLIDAADGEWRWMMLVAMRTGLRQGELLALRWEDVDLKTGLLRVRRSVTRGFITEPKSGKSRDVPLGDEVLASLKSQRHLRGELVFCTLDGAMLKKNECKHPLWRACRKAGLRRIGWHVLRHSFASHLAMRGIPLKVVQELLGHATMDMTMRYAHLSPNVPRDAVKALDRGVAPTWHPSAKVADGVR